MEHIGQKKSYDSSCAVMSMTWRSSLVAGLVTRVGGFSIRWLVVGVVGVCGSCSFTKQVV